jgi:glutamate racemase
MTALPNERIVYFGDTARTPYGSKAVGTIRNFAFEITDFLASEDVKMIVIACNTVSATCLSDLRARHPELPVIGIISPAAHTIAASCTTENKIGIIGTKVTIGSGAYLSKIREIAPDLNIHEAPCPIFVPLIEEGFVSSAIMDLSIKHYLDDFLSGNGIDTLVLGCTHYPLIKENISRLYPEIAIVDPSKEVVTSIEEGLLRFGLHANGEEEGGHIFYASDLSENFVNMIDRIFKGTGFTVAFKNFDLEAMV